VNKYLYLCHLLVLSSPMLMMHGHTNLKAHTGILIGIHKLLRHYHKNLYLGTVEKSIKE